MPQVCILQKVTLSNKRDNFSDRRSSNPLRFEEGKERAALLHSECQILLRASVPSYVLIYIYAPQGSKKQHRETGFWAAVREGLVILSEGLQQPTSGKSLHAHETSSLHVRLLDQSTQSAPVGFNTSEGWSGVSSSLASGKNPHQMSCMGYTFGTDDQSLQAGAMPPNTTVENDDVFIKSSILFDVVPSGVHSWNMRVPLAGRKTGTKQIPPTAG